MKSTSKTTLALASLPSEFREEDKFTKDRVETIRRLNVPDIDNDTTFVLKGEQQKQQPWLRSKKGRK